MSICGIIAEFNPLHNGHKLLLDAAKHSNDGIICAMSGNFTERGDVAVFRKSIRTKAALLSGADLVIELPTPWSMSGAENFALGGVSLLKNCGVDNIIFGSECGDINSLKKTAEILDSAEFKTLLQKYLSDGITFAAAREKAVKEVFPIGGEILSSPNNTLGVEYIKAGNILGYKGNYNTLQRVGAQHDSTFLINNFCSASYLRDLILRCEKLPENCLTNDLNKLYKNCDSADIKRLYPAFLYKLRQSDEAFLSKLPEISEGIENRLFKAIQSQNDFESILEAAKTKRYTMARIRRLVLNCCLNIDNRYLKSEPPYLRVLGFNKKGEELLRSISKQTNLPLILRSSDIKKCNQTGKDLFELEAKIGNIYELAFASPLPCGEEYRYSPVKL